MSTNKRIAPIIAALLLIWVLGKAQSPNVEHFTPLKSQGEFPEFLASAANKPASSKSDDAFLSTMLAQGKVLYGTELNQYIDFIAEQLLANEPLLRKSLHFYILQVPEVNAFSTSNGAIFINMGLLAQVTNESQLAFVMAHEIAHYSEGHGKETKKSKSSGTLSDYLRWHQYSREQEIDADHIGLTRFYKSSPYSLDILDGLYDVLLYSSLPFDEIPFRRNEVEESFYAFPDNYFLTTVANISDRSTMVDTFLTHPNIEKRRALAKKLITAIPNNGRKIFVQPESQFYHIRDIARFSCVEYYLLRHKYDKAIYNIHVLQQQFPNNEFLEKSLATAYYGASKHKNFGMSSVIATPYREVEGEMQQVSYLMGKMNRKEYSVLALRKAWTAMQRYPDDEYLRAVAQDLVNDLFVKQKMKYNDFCDYPQDTRLEDIAQNATGTASGTDKYSRIKQQSQTALVLPDPKFKTVNYMLVDIHRDSLFREMVNEAVVNGEIVDMLESATDKHLDRDSVLCIFEPNYTIYSKASRDKRARQADRSASQLLKVLTRSTNKMGVKAVTYSSTKMPETSTERYNEFVQMRNWIDDFDNGGGLAMRYHTSDYLNDALQAIGGGKACRTVVTRNTVSSFTLSNIYTLSLALVSPYLWPIAIANTISDKYDTDVHFHIVDMKTGKVEVSSSYTQSAPMSRAYVNGFCYNQLRKYIKGK